MAERVGNTQAAGPPAWVDAVGADTVVATAIACLLFNQLIGIHTALAMLRGVLPVVQRGPTLLQLPTRTQMAETARVTHLGENGLALEKHGLHASQDALLIHEASRLTRREELRRGAAAAVRAALRVAAHHSFQ